LSDGRPNVRRDAAKATTSAVYRFRDGKIAQVWFHDDGYDPEAFSAVFRFE
jgi:hypothetical protein